jgi:type IV secretory pathway TraG/TraD family ATPase VirD4
MAGRDNPRDDKVRGVSAGHVVGFILLGSFVGFNIGGWMIQRAAVKLSDIDADSPPFMLGGLILVFTDDYVWPTLATTILVTLVVAVVAITVLVFWLRKRKDTRGKDTGENSRIDHVTRHLASTSDIRSLSPETRKHQHYRKNLPDVDWYGFEIGQEVASGQRLLSGSEDQVVDIWAPRMGKTTSRILPQIYTAPGLVVATSCKRDVIDDSIRVRSQIGDVWVFDPQDMVPELQGDPWYFDPLDYVRRNRNWDSNATTLAEIFEAATNDHGNVSDGDQNGFFYQQARKLLKGMFMAATVDDQPITAAFRWVMRPEDDEPLRILKDSEWSNVALGMEAQYDEEERTRSNVFAAAANIVECLSTRTVGEWVTPVAGSRKLNVADLAADETATLYLMTKDDEPVARPITSILVVMLLKELEARAETYPRNRLPVPVTMALDEIANVVRWPQLPTKFSTYGSLGILCDVVLQSYPQGEELWGVNGMRKLWAAAAIRVIGPGQVDDEFSGKLAKAIGNHTEIKSSASYSAGGVSRGDDVIEKETLPASEVQALPMYRMIVTATGRRPMLARMVRWQDQTYTPEVEQRLVAAGLVESDSGEPVTEVGAGR